MIIEKNGTRMRLIELIFTDTFKESVVYPSNPFHPCSIENPFYPCSIKPEVVVV